MNGLKEKIREAALALGFDAIGFAAAGDADPEGRFSSWLEAGFHADLDYMERRAKERADPRVFFPEVKTVIMLAIFYRFAAPRPEDDALRGEISCYARGADYHRVIGKKLKRLREEISRLSPSAKIYHEVDTGPILEKVWAARAGLGWIAKSSNLLTRRGSWLFLASVLTDLALPPDAPQKDFCGSCRRCLDACPTQAIVAPGVVDARRCISYLTIENRGPVPRHLREGMGRWVFGCDDCQTVCPWQKFDPGAKEEKFRPREGLTAPDLLALLSLDDEGFLRQFAGTPVMRAKRRGMRRNALVALGNLKDPRALPALARVLTEDPDPMLRGHAAWALGKLEAHDLLRKQREIEKDPEVLEEIDAAIPQNK